MYVLVINAKRRLLKYTITVVTLANKHTYVTRKLVYFLVVCGAMMMTFVAVGTVKAAKTMHNLLLDNVLKCPMSFFDTTPLGRIINRCSRQILI